MEVIHVSFVMRLGTVTYIHSITLFLGFGGTVNSGPLTTMSGSISHPSAGHRTGTGASFALPSGAPASTHREMVSISLAFSERSLAKWPTCGSANHGGIFFVRTAVFIAFAHGRTSLYVSRDIGAI